MATAPTAGYFYFVESTTGVDDWITDHGGDPDDIDLSLMTEGTHYCKIEIPKQWVKAYWTGIIVTDMGGGKSVGLRTGMKAFQVLTNGVVTSRANAALIEKFIMSDRHTNPSSTTFKQYYLIGYFGTTDHILFTDAADSQKHYCKGVITKAEELWNESENQVVSEKITFRSTW